MSYGRYIHFKPTSIHQWAQSDRASVALNYYQESMDFFLPRVHNISNGTGITGLEFPILNYLAAIFYKIFGYDEFWYRLISLSIVSIGLFSIFKLCNKFVNDVRVSTIIVLLFFLSPTLVYYTPNFLPDAPSLGFILVSWLYFFKYKDSNKNIHLLLFTIFSALSILIKITSLISIVCILIVLLLDWLKFFKKKEFDNKLKILSAIIIISLSVFSWYAYSKYLNEKYESWYFLMKIKPVRNFNEIRETYKIIEYFWLKDYYDKSIISLIFVSIIYLIINFRRGNLVLNTITLLLIIGDICFVLLMLFQFRDHDYYIITLLTPIIFLFISVFIIFKEKEYIFNNLSKLLLIVLLITNIFYCKKNINDRYSYNISKDYYGNKVIYDKLLNLTSDLRKIGITYDKVFTIMFDNSPNITLYNINQKGYVVENTWNDADLEKFILKSDYILIENEHVSDRDMYKKYFNNKVLEKDGISVFKLN